MIQTRHNGFTLIEIMIVMLIIGIVFSMITLTTHFSRTEKLRLKDQAHKIYSALLIAQDLAKLHNQYYAVTLDKDRYQLYRLEVSDSKQTEWISIKQPKNFSIIKLSPEVGNYFLEKEKHLILLDKKIMPDIIFYNDGRVTPFNLSLYIKKDKTIYINITGTEDGDISITSLD